MVDAKQCKDDGVVCEHTTSEDRRTGNQYRSARIMTEEGLVVVFTHTNPRSVTLILGENTGGTFENGHRSVGVHVNKAGRVIAQVGGQDIKNQEVAKTLLDVAHNIISGGRMNSSQANALYGMGDELAKLVLPVVEHYQPEIIPPKGLPRTPLIDPGLLKK